VLFEACRTFQDHPEIPSLSKFTLGIKEGGIGNGGTFARRLSQSA